VIETTLVKRRALYRGEVGLFPSTPMALEDINTVANEAEVMCGFYSPRHLEALKFLWALVDKTSQNSDRYLDKDEAMSDLKLRAGHSKLLYDDKTKKLELRPKSLKRISAEQLRQLTEKIITIICVEVLPGMEPNELRAEVEEMCKIKQESKHEPAR